MQTADLMLGQIDRERVYTPRELAAILGRPTKEVAEALRSAKVQKSPWLTRKSLYRGEHVLAALAAAGHGLTAPGKIKRNRNEAEEYRNLKQGNT